MAGLPGRDRVYPSRFRHDAADDGCRCGALAISLLDRSWPYLAGAVSISGSPATPEINIAARTDYLVNGPHDCLLFLTAAKQDREEGRVLCARTKDGGKTWNFNSWIGPEPAGFSIMPSTVRLGPAELLTALRHHEGDKKWIDLYRSLDDGGSWQAAGTPRTRYGREVIRPPCCA